MSADEPALRELVDMLPQVVFEADASGRITFVNQRAFEMFGYARLADAL